MTLQLNEPEMIKLSDHEAEQLKQRIRDSNLPRQDVEFYMRLISFHCWIQKRLKRAKLTLKRLRQIFHTENEKKS